MSYDEIMVAAWKALPDVLSICGDRVYHLEVAQNTNSQIKYPCLVYELSSDLPEQELGGNPDLYYATFSLRAFSKKSSDVKAIAAALASMSYEDYLDVFLPLHPEIGWIEAVEDTDMNEFAQEQQEKGYRVSSVLQLVTHSGK